MSCANLAEFPLPSSSNIGWPWTEQTEGLPQRLSDDSELPRISIVTPSYNQGQFIEETIRSVLLQGYPNLEYIIIDGGSTDNSVEIIKKYDKWITYWVSEPDRGQAHGINKGLERATGEILAYLNSDDYYLPGALWKVAEHWSQFPQTDLLHGRCRYVDEQGDKIGEQFGNITRFDEIIDLWDVWWKQRQFVQPEVFWTKRIKDKVGLFREELFYAMDYDYWCRILNAGGIVGTINEELSCFRFASHQKSNHREDVANELLQIVSSLIWDYAIPLPLQRRLYLQSQWLYQSVFLKEVKKSVKNNDSTKVRWLKSLLAVLRYPKIVLSYHFRARIISLIQRIINYF